MIHLQSPLLSRAAPAVPVYLFLYLWSLAVWLRWAASCDADPYPAPTPAPGMMEVLPGRCVPIAKRELLWAGSAGLACWLAGVIFIDRKRTGDAISVMSEVAQTLLTQDVSHPGEMGLRG